MLKNDQHTLMIKQNIKHLFTLIVFTLLFVVPSFAQDVKDYSATVKSADEYYQNKDYYNAKAAYQLASKLKPEEAYPKEKIKEIIGLLKAEMAVRGEYDDLVEQADEAMKSKDYETAITNYKKALTLIAYEAHPKKQLQKAQNLLEAEKLKNSIYGEAIKTADQHFSNKEYEQALSFYRDAANVDESQDYPKTQIAKITHLIQNQNANQQNFEQAITKADQLLNYQKFSEALAEYQKAASIKPEDAYAKAQVLKMKSFIEKEKEYDKITAKADQLYVKKNFVASKLEYQKAQEVLPEKTYALNMISKIDASLDKEQKKLAKLEQNYQDAIKTGDQLFKDKKYQAAYSKYSKALELKPNETYPKTQLEEIDILLATGYLELSCFVHEDNKGLFDSRIQLKENGSVLETDEIGTNGRYKLKLDLNKHYQIRFYKSGYVQKIFDVNTELPREVNHNNIFEYNLVVELFPKCSADLSILDKPLTNISYFKDKGNFYFDEQRTQIILNKVKELKKECKKLKEEEEQQGEYDKTIAKADKYLGQSNYSKALENYHIAAGIMPAIEYPKQKIAEIQAVMEAADKYQALIVSADAKYKAKDYEAALYDYYAAKNLKPKEAYPQEKIQEIDGIINAQKDLDAKYTAQIAQADSLYALDSLTMAISSYRMALKTKLQETYPKNQIAKIEREIKQKQDLEKRYQDAVSKADKMFEAENFADAAAAYLIASQIKPDEMYPKYKIEDINTIEEQRRVRAMNDNYEQLITQADGYFNKASYQDALPLYQKAAKLKPKEAYPPAQIDKINALLAQLQAQEGQYRSLIASADQKYAAKDYASSFDDYKQASKLKPEEQYPKDQMAEIESIMKKMADLEMAYQDAIKQADAAYDAKDWNAALSGYQKALELKPQEQYPQDRIAEINTLLQGMADQDAAYKAAIADGDARFAAKEWPESLTAFQKALSMKPEEAYPQKKVAEINALMKSEQQRQDAYNAAIAKADELFAAATYVDAKAKYQEALSIIPNQDYPTQKIAEIEALLKKRADSEALYAQLIQSGDALLGEKKYQASIEQYQQALQIKAQEAYPAQKIKEIEAILAAIAEKDSKYKEAIAAADKNRDSQQYPAAISKYQEAASIKPKESYPVEQIGIIQALLDGLAKKDANYQALISAADEKYQQQAWQVALEKYKEALAVKPQESYPQTKIQEIEATLKAIAEKEAAYNQAIAEADASYKAKDWPHALTKYQSASTIKPEEQYPKDKIAELNTILGDIAAENAKYNALIGEADQLFDAKDYPTSKEKYAAALAVKKQEYYPQERIQAIDAILAKMAENQRQYDLLIKDADKLFMKSSWDASLEKYQAALQIIPNETHPKEQIAIINSKLMDIVKQREAYDALIQEADGFFNTQEYENALAKYEAASLVLVAETYPKEQIKKIRNLMDELAKKNADYKALITKADDLLAQESYEKSKEKYQAALVIFPEKTYPQEQITLIDELIAKTAQYNQFVSLADEAFRAKDYENALSNYQQAQILFPQKEYPPKKIAEVNTIMQAMAMVRAAYDAAVNEGDAHFAAKEYDLAKVSYQEALKQLSSEVYPRQKIMEIDQILQDMARKRMQFDKVIAQANAAFDKKSYDMALTKYTAALEILPEEEYPQKRIEEIRDILASIADQQTRYESLVSQGGQAFDAKDYQSCIDLLSQAQAIFPNEAYPPKKIAEAKAELAKIQREIDVAYQKEITAADGSFRAKKWAPAKESYQKASEIKPEELYPKNKLAEINAILEKELQKQQKEYDKYIADGERFYGTKYYQESILSFEKALNVFPYEKYPVEMIDKIFELIKKTSMISLLDNKMQIVQNQEKKFKFNTISFKDRKENYILLEIKVVDPDSQVKLFVNFGNGGSQNGGYSIHLKNGDGYHRYFVNIGKQVRWVNNDNDYISLLPEGGGVEVKLIKISRNGI